MRENPMCKGCAHLDAISADPEIPCAFCGYPSSTDQTSESVDQSPEAVERLAVTLEETNNWETEAHIKLATKAAATLRALSSAINRETGT